MIFNRDYRRVMEIERYRRLPKLAKRNKWYSLLIVMACFIGLFFIFIVVAFAGEVDTTKAVIHHTASGDVSAATIDSWHKKRGWDGCGYHFIIRQNGEVERGRTLEKRGAHARKRNSYIGIALTGRDHFTREQINSLFDLLKRLGVRYIEKHHEYCPGSGLDIEALQNKLGGE